MVYTDFLKAAESGRWERGCLFYGAEEYLKRYALDRVKAALFPDPALLDWNRRAFDDENYTPADLREAPASRLASQGDRLAAKVPPLILHDAHRGDSRCLRTQDARPERDAHAARTRDVLSLRERETALRPDE